jgi:hypothetical protein
MRARTVREYKLEIASMILIAGVIFSLAGVAGTYFPHSSIPVIGDLVRYMGEWNVWLVVLGPMFLIAGGWVVGDNIAKRREFNRLITTHSKATFVRNLDRLEELAWLLSEDHERRVWEKKQELHIK